MLERLETLYDATLRPLGALHRVLRWLAWTSGDLLVGVTSSLVRFELPGERLFPFYKLQMLLGTYESSTVEACRRLIRPGMTVFDVGAHAGYYTLLFSRLVGPAGRVFAFEPHPETFALLQGNATRYGLDNVSLCPLAVSDRDGRVALWETPLSMGHSLHRVKPDARSREVETVALDGFCRQRGVEHVDLVKLDVEGAEPEVLDGMRELASRSHTLSLIVEFKSELCLRRGMEPGAWMGRLSALGFRTAEAVRDGQPVRTVSTTDPHALRDLAKCNLIASRATAERVPR